MRIDLWKTLIFKLIFTQWSDNVSSMTWDVSDESDVSRLPIEVIIPSYDDVILQWTRSAAVLQMASNSFKLLHSENEDRLDSNN